MNHPDYSLPWNSPTQPPMHVQWRHVRCLSTQTVHSYKCAPDTPLVRLTYADVDALHAQEAKERTHGMSWLRFLSEKYGW